MASTMLATSLLLTTTACSSGDEVTTKPNTPAKSERPTADAKTTSPEPSKEADAKVGDSITLRGANDGEQLDVTVKKFLDPAKGADEFNQPQSGKKWVAVQLQLVNTGSRAYSDSPANGAKVADTDGQRFDSWFGEIAAGPAMASDLNLPAGEKALGWIVFEIPKTSKVVTVQYGMNSGFAEQTGQWKVS
ncbi:DUF4352 domain-containing protein [Streptomyces sp. NPDC014006]|uniref:DUF4352 domain-containing protein n=1 Tax=Streptomyces sp. NPDC014006 TaxID=3364870 RepID=UPI0036FACB79